MKESQEFQEEQELDRSIFHKKSKTSKDFNLGKRLGLVLLSSIFVIELLIMLIGRVLKIQFTWFEAPIDSFLLTILIFPVIYFLVIRPITIQNKERKRVEDELQESESKYRSLVETAQELVWKCDANGQFTYLNPAWEKTHGYKLYEMIGKSFSEFQRPEIFEKDIIEFNSHMAGGSVKEYETKHKTKNGKELTLLFNAIPIFDQNGNVIGTQGTAIDITERKQAQEDLEKNRALLLAIIEGTSDAIYVKDIEGRYLLFNNAAERITGKKTEDVIGKDDYFLFPPEEAAVVMNGDRKVIEGGTLATYEEIVTTTSKITTFLSTKGPIFDNNGNSIGLFGVARDISERKLADELIHESATSLEEAQHLAHIGSWEWDLVSDTVKWSKEMYRVFDINPETYDGKPEALLKVLHPDDVEHFTTSMNSNRAGGKSLNLEYRVIHKDGSIHTIFAKGRVEVNGAGTPVKNIGIVQDITERKLAENERKLSQEKLREFATMLQQSREEERKSIAREIHDEFGQVLTAIKMNLTMLGNEVSQTDKPYRKAAVMDEIINMKSIIDYTIHKVRVFTNKLRPDVLDTFGLVEALDAHIDEFAKLYNIKCTFEKSEEEITIEMNRSIAVYRIVQEALTNVARHAQATKVWIYLNKMKETLFLSIEDNGIGMTEKQEGKEKKFGITGMKERAYICGGSLTIFSIQQKGTTIELTIPLKEDD